MTEYMKKLIEQYPYLERLSDSFLFTTEDDIEILRSSDKINIDNDKLRAMPVSVELLRRILTDSSYFEYAYKCVNEEIDDFKIACIKYGDVGGAMSHGRVPLVLALKKMIETTDREFSSIEMERYNELRDCLSLKSFLDIHRDEKYSINIEGNMYDIPIKDIFSLLSMDYVSFSKLCSSDVAEIKGIPKERFVYAVRDYILRNKILERVILDDVMYDRFDDIDIQPKIDIQAINRYLTTKDTVYREAVVDDDLRKAIFDGMPDDISDLEKALYIYIKMCKTLTYDDEYYAVNQRGVATAKHQDIGYVSTITPENNKVVCFEFNAIYSKFLSELGINFGSDYKGSIDESYGDSHANLEFRCGKFLVRADAVTSILSGDIARSKINQPLVGLMCFNFNMDTQKEFDSSLEKVYFLIKEQEKEKNDVVREEQSFDELLSEYMAVTDKMDAVGFNEKVDILMNKITSANMAGIDSFSYLLHLRKILFNNGERDNNINISIIRNNEPLDPERVAMAGSIISINEDGFPFFPEDTKYYYFTPGMEVQLMTLSEVQDRFDNCLFQYVTTNDPKIPGIIEGGKNDARKASTY